MKIECSFDTDTKVMAIIVDGVTINNPQSFGGGIYENCNGDKEYYISYGSMDEQGNYSGKSVQIYDGKEVVNTTDIFSAAMIGVIERIRACNMLAKLWA